MRRKLLNFATAVSLGLLLVVGALAMARPTGLRVGTPSHPAALHAESDGLTVVVRSYAADRRTRMRFLPRFEWDAHPASESLRLKPNRLGFAFGKWGRLSGPGRLSDPTPPVYLYWDRIVLVPWWSLVLAGATLPAIRLIRFVRRRQECERKVAARLCLCCGYDLRATPERCPECGEPAPTPAAA